jgi:hypothetical protein
MKTLTSLVTVLLTVVTYGQDPAGELAKLKADPLLLTTAPRVTLSGRSQGGKSRFTPWATDYGSYNREDVSARQYVANFLSTARYPQRVRAQCFLIVRNIATNELQSIMLEDYLIDLPVNGRKTASAFSEVSSTDDNYVALGVRYQDGLRYLGWVWRCIDATNRVTNVASSTSGYDRIGREEPVKPYDSDWKKKAGLSE